MMFKKAEKKQCKLRMGLFAPSGGGKTYTSLLLAKAFGSKIAFIDTENESSTKYIGEQGIPEFDIAAMTYEGNAAKYVRDMIACINAAQDEYDCIVIDSLTHAWEATKDEVDAAAKRMRTANTFAAWREGSTLWGNLLKAILLCRTNIICCARSKMAYEQTTESGKKKVNKVGLAPELRDGMEFEFDIVGEMDVEHNLVVTKTRCRAVDNSVTSMPNEEWMKPVAEWLSSGVADTEAERRALWEKIKGTEREDDVIALCKGRGIQEQIEIMKGALDAD